MIPAIAGDILVYVVAQEYDRGLTRAKAGCVAMAAGRAALTAATFFATLFSALQEMRAARESHSLHSLYCWHIESFSTAPGV